MRKGAPRKDELERRTKEHWEGGRKAREGKRKRKEEKEEEEEEEEGK